MAKNVIPKSVSDYIKDELGRKLSEVVAHRNVSGAEPKYAVLMRNNDGTMFTVVFVGSYTAIRPLGDYEEAHPGNAQLKQWECISDGDEWEHSVGLFKTCNSDYFQ